MQAIDAGTMVEVGYAYRMRRESGKKPIMVYYAETLGNAPFNLMLAQSADIVITNYDDLANLPKLIEENKTVDYKGMIE